MKRKIELAAPPETVEEGKRRQREWKRLYNAVRRKLELAKIDPAPELFEQAIDDIYSIAAVTNDKPGRTERRQQEIEKQRAEKERREAELLESRRHEEARRQALEDLIDQQMQGEEF